MNLEFANNVLMPNVGDGSYINFPIVWVKELQACPYQHYGDFIRKTIYPAWAAEKRKKHNLKIPMLSAKELRIIINQYTKANEI